MVPPDDDSRRWHTFKDSDIIAWASSWIVVCSNGRYFPYERILQDLYGGSSFSPWNFYIAFPSEHFSQTFQILHQKDHQ